MHKNLKAAVEKKIANLPHGIVADRKCGGKTFTCDGFITYFDKYGRLEAHLVA